MQYEVLQLCVQFALVWDDDLGDLQVKSVTPLPDPHKSDICSRFLVRSTETSCQVTSKEQPGKEASEARDLLIRLPSRHANGSIYRKLISRLILNDRFLFAL
jgi:hypothetical protein